MKKKTVLTILCISVVCAVIYFYPEKVPYLIGGFILGFIVD